MTADTLSQRFRRGYAELGPLRFALILLITLFAISAIAVYFSTGTASAHSPAFLLSNVVISLWAAERLLDRSRPDWLWGLILAAGAAILWAQYFGLVPYPIQGA